MNEEVLAVLAKLVGVVETLTRETADLLDGYSSSFRGDYVVEIRQRADVLRAAGLQLRTISDKALPKQD